jgi:hypothetical protein
MNKSILLIIGIIILLFSLLTDVIGIGYKPGFGAGQIAGTVVGAIIIIVALMKMTKKR